MTEVAGLLEGTRKEYIDAVPLAKLHPNPWNPNRMDERTFRAERESIRSYGFIDPCTVRPHPDIDDEWQILDGEHRWRAAGDEGIEHVDLIVLHGLSDERAKKLTIIMNETRGSPDEAALARLIADLDASMSREELMNALPYANDELERMLSAATFDGNVPEVDLDEAPEPPEEPESKTGEVYELGPHRLMCGDSSKIEDVQTLMGGQTAHMVMADPPYNVGYEGGTRLTGNPGFEKRGDSYEDERGAEYGPWLTTIIENGAAWSDEHAVLHLWFAVKEWRAVLKAIAAGGWEERALIVWGKSGPTGTAFAQYKAQFEQFYSCAKKGKTPRWHGPTNESTLWQYDKPHRNELHPVMRPVEMYQREIRNHTEAGHSVLELFGGSGTTLMACEVSQRRAFLMEVDPRYCDVIRQRYAKYMEAKGNLEWSEANT